MKGKKNNSMRKIQGIFLGFCLVFCCFLMMGCHEHTYGEWQTEKEPTCTDEGLEHRYCDCGETEERIIEKTSHTVTNNTKTESGDGYTCLVCQQVISKEEAEDSLPTNRNITLLSEVTYEGDTDGNFVFYWKEARDYENTIQTILVTVDDGKESQTFRIPSDAASWAYTIQGDSGKYTFSFSPIDRRNIQGRTVSCTCLWLPEIYTMDFPRVEITTQNGELPTYDPASPPTGNWGAGITNNEYVPSIVRVYNKDNELLYASSEDSFLNAKIRIRGNTSAQGAKQPFKIKLTQKVDLLAGLIERADPNVDYTDKNWVLLTSGTSFNTAVGNTVSKLVGMEWVPEYSYVALFVNGDYRGLYILSEGVKDGEGRCDISNTGYLVEMDAYWWNEDLYFTTPISENYPAKYTFKYPENITETSLEYKYIQNYISQFENALLAGEDVSEWIDMESFAKWILVHDILSTWDSGGSNMYLYKYDNTDDSKLHMGPVWDFDTSYWGTELFARIRGEVFFYYPQLFANETFVGMYEKEFRRVKDRVLDAVLEELSQYETDAYETLLRYEAMRWGGANETAKNQVNALTSWFVSHLAWMEKNI